MCVTYLTYVVSWTTVYSECFQFHPVHIAGILLSDQIEKDIVPRIVHAWPTQAIVTSLQNVQRSNINQQWGSEACYTEKHVTGTAEYLLNTKSLQI